MRTRTAILSSLAVIVSLASVASVASAQKASTIDPGMTREQVVATLGEPLSARQFQGYTYMLYRNGCEKKCGMSDLVVLDSGKVVDAVFRSPARHYSGTSSSPHMMSVSEAKREGRSPQPGKLALPQPKKPTA
jgi:hypothetical protein